MMLTCRHMAILFAVSMFLFLAGLGDMALTDPDETFYAQTAGEMSESNEWLTPIIFGEPQFEKPVLYYWLVLASYKVFGVSEFAARFPSVVFGFAGVVGIYLLGRVMFSPLCGLLSGLIMATSAEYIVLARACVTDMVLTVFILFCLLFFVLAWTRGKRAYYLLASVMAGLAVLTKGPVGLFIPAVVAGLYISTGGRWKEMRRVPVLWSMLVFLAVCLPWYVMMTKIHGNAFIGEFFGFQNITRFLKPEHRIGSSPFFYIPVITGGFFPWIAFLPYGAWVLCKWYECVSPVASHKLFLALWFLTVFIFFSISRTKLVTYIFPLFPVMAVVTGRFWERIVRGADKYRGMKIFIRGAYYVFLFSTLAGLFAVYFVVKSRYVQAVKPLLLCEAVFVTGLFLSFIFFLKRRMYPVFFSIVLAVVFLSVPLVRLVLPVIEVRESSRVLASRLKELAGPGDPVGAEDDHRWGVAFYSGRVDIEDIHPYPDLIDFIRRRQRVWGIVQEKHFDQVKKDKADLYLEPVFSSGKYVLFTNKPYSNEYSVERED